MNSNHTRAGMGLLALGSILLASSAYGSGRGRPMLHPKTYASPSGKYALFVNPSDIYGRFGATYKLSCDGTEVWQAEHDFTLWGAGVTDAGVIAGYGYTQGPEGLIEVGKGYGKFHVVVINPAGEFILNESTDREHHWHGRSGPDPLAHGLIVHQDDDRFIVRITNQDDGGRNSQPEYWWTYRISTGERLETFKPLDQMTDVNSRSSILDAQPVQGTPLTLLRWSLWTDSPEGDCVRGVRFTLVDGEANPLWVQDLRRDLMIAKDQHPQSEVQRWSYKNGGIFKSPEEGSFEILSVADASRVLFTVDKSDQSQWQVTEKQRVPFEIPSIGAPSDLAIPEESLQYIGELTLGSAASVESPFENVQRFDIDSKGRIAFLRNGADHVPSLTVANRNGELLKEFQMPEVADPECARWLRHAWVGDMRLFARQREIKDRCRSKAWFVDVGKASRTQLQGLEVPSIHALAGMPDGGFVAAGYHRPDGAAGFSTIFRFDSSGKLVWMLPNRKHSDPERLRGATDLAVTKDGQILVLANVADTVQIFSEDGELIKTIDLEEAWGRDPNYITDIAADFGDGFVIRDFNGPAPLVRCSADGRIIAEIKPRYADGRSFQMLDIAVDNDGRIWTCDGHSLLRLDGEGVATVVLGEAPDPNRLGLVGGLTVDQRGRIYAVDQRTGSVHVHDASGQLLHVCEANPTDFRRDVRGASITVARNGEVFLGIPGDRTPESPVEFAHFSANGARLGNRSVDVDWNTQRWHAQPGTDRIWVVGYHDLSLVDKRGTVISRIKRRFDGDWLERPSTASVAPDGTIAVVAAKTDGMGISRVGTLTVNIYDPDGQPTGMFTLPELVGQYPTIAFDGARVVVAGEHRIVLFSVDGTPLLQMAAPVSSHAKPRWYPFIRSGGRELLLFDGHTPVLHRYMMH